MAQNHSEHNHQEQKEEKYSHDLPSCCAPKEATETSCCEPQKKDNFFNICLGVIVLSYIIWLAFGHSLKDSEKLHIFTKSIFDITNQAWWGVLLGIFFVSIISKIPQDKIFKIMGRPGTVSGVVKATIAGVLFDMCNHGILFIGVKLYKRGLSYGQLCAFLLSSPWNSISLTFIMISLIGVKYTFLFIILSAVIGIITGILIDRIFPHQPNLVSEENEDTGPVKFKLDLKPASIKRDLLNGLIESKSIMKWLLFGIILTALIRTFVDPAIFEQIFGPTLQGIGMTLFFATVIEVCSEGSTPIAADILNRAHAVGNAFAFLMAGVATDYTEIMILREATKSWKKALILPAITVPMVVLAAFILNG